MKFLAKSWPLKYYWTENLGNSDSAAVRELACDQCDLDSIPAGCHMWVEFFKIEDPHGPAWTRVKCKT